MTARVTCKGDNMDAVVGRVDSDAAKRSFPKRISVAGAPPPHRSIPFPNRLSPLALRSARPKISALTGTSFKGALAFVLLCVMAGCDDGTVISRVDSTTTLDRARILSMAKDGLGVPLEVHGAPWSGVAAEEVAAKVRLPNSFPPEIRFRPTTPGELDPDHDKVVMVFNPSRPPNVSRLCGQTASVPTEPPKDGPFQAFVALCDGPEWMGMGVLDASRQAAGDWPEFTRATRVLFSRIFADFTGRSEK